MKLEEKIDFHSGMENSTGKENDRKSQNRRVGIWKVRKGSK
jgi:hypothetical protein